MNDPVKLRITETTPGGRSEVLTMERRRAQELLACAERQYGADGPYRFAIEENNERPMAAASPPMREGSMQWAALLAGLLGLLEACLAFAKSHLFAVAGIVLGILLVLSVYLPTAHARVYPVVMLMVISVAIGFLSTKVTPQI